MVHDLLDKSVFEVELYHLEENWDKDSIIENLTEKKLIEKIMVQKTAFKNLYREIVTGQVIEALVIEAHLSDDLGIERWETKKVYPKTNAFVYINKTYAKSYRKVNLNEIREYINKHADREAYYLELKDLIEKGKQEREDNLIKDRMKKRTAKNFKKEEQRVLKEQERHLLRTLKKNQQKGPFY